MFSSYILTDRHRHPKLGKRRASSFFLDCLKVCLFYFAALVCLLFVCFIVAIFVYYPPPLSFLITDPWYVFPYHAWYRYEMYIPSRFRNPVHVRLLTT